MKKRNILTIILAGFIIIPIFMALYNVNSSFNLPFPVSNQISFQLSSSTSFQENLTISPQDPALDELSSSIAIDSKNIIHLVYVNSSNGNDIVYSNSTNFTVVKRISNNPNPDESPAIAIDNNDNIYIVWVANDSIQKDIVITNSSDWFSTNFTISKNDSHDDTAPDIAIGNNGIVHIVWEAPHNITGIKDIWYTNSSSNYQNYTVISDNPQNIDRMPSIAVGPDNNYYIVWCGLGTGTDEIWHVNSTDNLQSNRTISSNPLGTAVDLNPDIVVTESILITWRANVGGGIAKILLVDSSNNWKNITISNNPNQNILPRIVKGPGDLIHILWTRSVLATKTNYTVYTNSLDNYTSNSTVSDNSTSLVPGDIGIDNNGKVHIIWVFNNQTYYRKSIYPAVNLLVSILIPMEPDKPGTAMLAHAELFDEFYIEKVEIMWSTNTGVSWNTFLMFGPVGGTKWTGNGIIPGYQYGVVLLYKYKIVDKTGMEHETDQQIFYYPDTRTESIVLIIILFGVLGALTALYLIPQTRNFFGRLFSRKKPETDMSKKAEAKKTPES